MRFLICRGSQLDKITPDKLWNTLLFLSSGSIHCPMSCFIKIVDGGQQASLWKTRKSQRKADPCPLLVSSWTRCTLQFWVEGSWGSVHILAQELAVPIKWVSQDVNVNWSKWISLTLKKWRFHQAWNVHQQTHTDTCRHTSTDIFPYSLSHTQA